MESDRQIILTLQKSLEAEKLRNLNLSAELELQRNMSLGSGANLTGKHEDRGFYSSAPGKIPVVLLTLTRGTSPSLSLIVGFHHFIVFSNGLNRTADSNYGNWWY